MWWSTLVWAGAPLPDLNPRGPDVIREARMGAAVVRTPPVVSGGTRPASYHPNVHASGTYGVGWPAFHGTIALHAEVARYLMRPGVGPFAQPDSSYTDVRFEPRLGFRVTAPTVGLFLGAEFGFALATVSGPVIAATLGWAGRGDGVRPVIAVEGRGGVCLSENSLPGATYCQGAPGVLVSGGVKWGPRAAPVSHP
jgi:hypothetical protein